MLMIDEMNAMITLGKTAGLAGSGMLPYATAQFTRDANVERRTRIVADDVNPIIVVSSTPGPGEKLDPSTSLRMTLAAAHQLKTASKVLLV